MKCLSNCTYLVQVANKIRFIHADCLKSTTLGSDSLTEPLVPVTQTEYRPVSNFDGPNHVQDPQEPPKAEIAGRESKNSCTAEDTSKESSKPKTPLAQTPIAHRPKRTIKKLCGRRKCVSLFGIHKEMGNRKNYEMS
ncbi:hypothetical protein QE152_g29928 [Popillia japonica]|uniref:Uncharacterized protein n=1 Tax=Popillia japonica TaxID=7064 RepID=A0AAW1JGR9_POPJA